MLTRSTTGAVAGATADIGTAGAAIAGTVTTTMAIPIMGLDFTRSGVRLSPFPLAAAGTGVGTATGVGIVIGEVVATFTADAASGKRRRRFGGASLDWHPHVLKHAHRSGVVRECAPASPRFQDVVSCQSR